jgi:hypothetical protein
VATIRPVPPILLTCADEVIEWDGAGSGWHFSDVASVLRDIGSRDDYLACAAEAALMCFERWCGFGQAPSDGVHFAPVLSDIVDRLWFFCAALVGPIANLNDAPFTDSNADAG